MPQLLVYIDSCEIMGHCEISAPWKKVFVFAFPDPGT